MFLNLFIFMIYLLNSKTIAKKSAYIENLIRKHKDEMGILNTDNVQKSDKKRVFFW